MNIPKTLLVALMFINGVNAQAETVRIKTNSCEFIFQKTNKMIVKTLPEDSDEINKFSVYLNKSDVDAVIEMLSCEVGVDACNGYAYGRDTYVEKSKKNKKLLPHAEYLNGHAGHGVLIMDKYNSNHPMITGEFCTSNGNEGVGADFNIKTNNQDFYAEKKFIKLMSVKALFK